MRCWSVGFALLLGIAVTAELACSSLTATYNCAEPGNDTGQCNAGPEGVCVSTSGENFCAYPSQACPSGYSFGASAGPNAGVCVPPNASQADASIDGPVDAYVADAPAGSDVCFGDGSAWCLSIATSMMPLTFSNQDIFSHGDSSHASACTGAATVDNVNWCVVGGSDMTFSDQITIDDTAGSFPIAFVSAGTITINGTINAGSQKNRSFDPPGRSLNAMCPKLEPNEDNNGAGGGAGGTYGTEGGNGGNSHSNGAQASAVSANITTAILGGCPGGDGGQAGNSFGSVTNPGGTPGGVVYLVAKNGIVINSGGDVSVSGEGGEGGGAQSDGFDGGNSTGGGGGGTGGFVAFDTPTLMLGGSVFAGGGGAGGGASVGKKEGIVVSFVSGQSGTDGTTTAANGGQGGDANNGNGGTGGNGGFGSGQSGTTGQNGNGGGGGGGGGGGVGVIWLVGTPQPSLSGDGSLVGQVVAHP